MTTTIIAITNYELTLPIGKDAKTNSIKIFTKSNNQRIKNIFVNFSADRNERPLTQLLEETTTKARNIRLLLGENEILKFLDFLRNENNRNCIIKFDLEEGQQFVSGPDSETNIEGDSHTVLNLEFFALHSKVFNRKRNQLSQDVGNVLGR